MIQDVFKGFYYLLIGIIKSGLNQRNIITLPLNFTLNFLPIIIWLSIFNNAGLIPIDIRPTIHSKIAFISDAFMFGDWFDELNTQYSDNFKLTKKLSYFSSFTFCIIVLIIVPMSIWYYLYHIRKIKFNVVEWYDTIFHIENVNNTRRLRIILLPFLTPLISFFILNIDHIFASQQEENFSKTKDLIAWFSYVILHVTAPILTAVYLYVFHPAGTLKCFSFALGLQNICGVFTHLLFPTASPWFTHLYGINDTEHVSYTQEGFAAGLIRVDNHLGSHLNTKGFHLSPIVFGAVPSLHSAIAFQCFLFIFSRATSLKHRFSNNSNKKLRPDEDSLAIPLRDFNDNDVNSTISSDESVPPSNNSSMNNLTGGEDDIGFDVYSFDLEAANKEQVHFVKLYDDDSDYSDKWYFRVYNTGIIPKILIASYVILQWWATMYLDHHYRFDLFIGMLYSLSSFIIINFFILQPKILKHWINLRLGKVPDVDNEARTMGMRVFQGTKIEWFFDPLA